MQIKWARAQLNQWWGGAAKQEQQDFNLCTKYWYSKSELYSGKSAPVNMNNEKHRYAHVLCFCQSNEILLQQSFLCLESEKICDMLRTATMNHSSDIGSLLHWFPFVWVAAHCFIFHWSTDEQKRISQVCCRLNESSGRLWFVPMQRQLVFGRRPERIQMRLQQFICSDLQIPRRTHFPDWVSEAYFSLRLWLTALHTVVAVEWHRSHRRDYGHRSHR